MILSGSALFGNMAAGFIRDSYWNFSLDLPNKYTAGLPLTHSLHIFYALGPIFTPFKSVLCMESTL